MAEIGQDLFFASIPELNRLLVSREISAVELTRAVAGRLQSLGPRYNALALLLEPQAIRSAKAVDAELKRGRTRGPLQGIPYGVKDLLSFAGQPTTWGAKPYAGQVFDYDAAVIDKLSGVGSVLVGKLSTVELAGGGGPGSFRDRIGDIRVDRDPRLVLRRYGAAAHVRPGEPAWLDGPFLDSGQAWSVRAECGGLRPDPARNCGKR